MKRNAARSSAPDQRLALVLVATLGLALGATAAAQEKPGGTMADAATGGFVSAGDRCLVDSARDADGRTTITVRGELCDGRPFVKALMAGLTGNGAAASALDADFDVKVGALTGFNGTELHDVEMSVAAPTGALRDFLLMAKPGPASRLTGRLQLRSDGRRVMVLEADDSGTLLRFLDLYPHVRHGKMLFALDVAPPNQAARQGFLRLRDFALAGETALQPLVDPTPGVSADQLAMTRLSLSFEQLPDALLIRDGIAAGPSVGATVEGKLDFASNRLSLRGVLVPLYEGPWMYPPPLEKREGLFALSYEITGPPQAPVWRISSGPLAPGLLRKLFEFPADRR